MSRLRLLLLLALSSVVTAEVPPSTKVYATVYPETVVEVQANSVKLRDGTVLLFDDGKKKTFEAKLNSTDLEDQLSLAYPVGNRSFAPPAKNYDPGRFRCDEFFKATYGKTKREVQKNLVQITWMPKSAGMKIWVTKVNGVDKKLVKVSAELDALPDKLKKYVTKLGGTFNWRVIAGTSRLSAHSYGIAIDINPDKSSYWKWDMKYKYKNEFPKEIVEIFEKYGFIWGGKWYHYDTMHFEYRPELLFVEKNRSK